MNQTLRKWSPYEQTQLARHGLASLEVPTTNQQPVEYFTSRVDFLGWQFRVSPAVLIPRVETEELVELVWEDVQARLASKEKIRLVDVATGSGAIGLSVWRRLAERAKVGHDGAEVAMWLTDISPAALAVAQQNAAELQTAYAQPSFALPPPQFLESDLLEKWSAQQPIDILIANLPYIPTAIVAQLDASVKDFEPHLALDGGTDGLRLVEPLLIQAKSRLAPHGVIWLEIDDTHTQAQLEALQPAYQYEFWADSFGKKRFVRATL